ncbi:MAG: methionyl-tRNA formyltransferase [Firmicutes bacterium]|nr:methionyl-tRNA formyltransferase [Bacillota bacterium]
MEIIFMGTPDFAAYQLAALKDIYEVKLVVTQPDRPSGRGYKMTPPPVKVVAEKAGIPVIQPEKINTHEVISKLQDVNAEAIVVVAFGQLIPKSILEMAPLGCINLHGSLLPKYRGAAPIQRAIMNGEKVTGLTTMLMDQGWDTGDMLLTCEVAIDLLDTAGSLHDKLMEKGAPLLKKTLDGLEAGVILPKKQNHDEATYAPKITTKDRVIDWRQSALFVYNHLRALLPWPGIKFILNEKRVSLSNIELTDVKTDAANPGTVVEVTNDYFAVACLDYALKFTAIKPDGSRLLSVRDFSNGYNLSVGDKLQPLEKD